MLKPDSTRYPSFVQTRSIGPEWNQPDVLDPGVEANDSQVFKSQTDLPSELALDLRLREILQQARLATAASGAVIALARGDKIVCRVSLGDKAPSAGVSLNTRSGLAGACVQTRELQLCDDTLADPRVNVVACRDLGIRSIVVLPVLDGGELWGILELFSAIPRAFSESELQALQSLGRKISSTLREAIEGGSTTLGLEAFSQPPAMDPLEPHPSAPVALVESTPERAVVARRDYRTGALTAAVLALAVFLGWMVGRVGWTMAVNRAPVQFPTTPEEAQATTPAKPVVHPAPPRQEEPAVPAIPAISKSVPPVAAKPILKPKTPTATPLELNGGLVVYEHGKVVFRMGPSEKEVPPKADPGVVASTAIQQAATREDDGSVTPAPTSPPAANGYLLERVEPQYPEAARQQHIQGPVVLNVLVGASGLVREASVISGDPLLAQAATHAVRQWRFNPHQLNGKAVEFETRITVNFALPE
jgi:TonB family protein